MLQIAVSLWMHDPATRDATILKKAMTKNYINLETVTEVICSRTSSQLQTLKQIYHSTFGTYLESDIELQATGHHEKVAFLPLLQSIYQVYTFAKTVIFPVVWLKQKHYMRCKSVIRHMGG